MVEKVGGGRRGGGDKGERNKAPSREERWVDVCVVKKRRRRQQKMKRLLKEPLFRFRTLWG